MAFLRKKKESKRLSPEDVNSLKEQLRPDSLKKVEETKGEDNTSEILKSLSDLTGSVKSLAKRFDDVESRVDDLQTKEAISKLEPEKIIQSDGELIPKDENPVVQKVKEVLGNGDITQCQFEVDMEPAQIGVTFSLIIIPPKHLREVPDQTDSAGNIIIKDRRVKKIPYVDGVVGAENYAKVVKNYCVKWASNQGVQYFAK